LRPHDRASHPAVGRREPPPRVRNDRPLVHRNAAGVFKADGLAARIELERSNGEHPRVPEALAKLDAGDHEGALDVLLDELAAADGDDKERLRKVIVGVLDELGDDHPLARDGRRRLAQALY
jgi:putative thioredoxin